MDEEVQATRTPARWLAWATAVLLLLGVGAAGAVSGDGDQADQRIVTAAGSATGGVEPPTTTVVVPTEPPPPAPPTTAQSTTTTVATVATVAKAATTVLPTTQPSLSTTTTKAPGARVVTTTTTVAGATNLTIVNEHPLAVVVTVNGRTFQLAPGAQAGPVAIPRYDHGNDVVEVKLVQEPTCGTGDADRYFPAPGSYRMAIVASPGRCQPGVPSPAVKVLPI